MGEFRSKLEEIIPATELVFEPTPGFGRYRRFFPESAISFPAKANTNLLEYLIKKYTKEGDLILDCMAGSYSTCVVGALLGRNCIGIDIEEKFYQWGLEAKERVERTSTLTPKGKMVVLKGDARNLTEILSEEIDSIITSPPYADAKKGVADAERMARRWEEYRSEKWNTWGRSAHTPGRIRGFESLGSGYSRSKDNIGNLPYGNVDVVITSPPYSETLSVKSGGMKGKKNAPKTSTVGSDGNPQLYSDNPDNIGNLPFGCIDAIITSPPYEASLEGTSRHTRGGIASRDRKLAQTGSITVLTEDTKKGVPICYSPNEDNIGNLKSTDEEYAGLVEGKLKTKNGKPTYLSEMFKVYREMWKVLKPGGLAIIVIKPFIRNKKVIDLPYHTWLLLKMAGFKLEELLKLRLKQVSFWRILYERRFPFVPKIRHEYILVCRKKV